MHDRLVYDQTPPPPAVVDLVYLCWFESGISGTGSGLQDVSQFENVHEAEADLNFTRAELLLMPRHESLHVPPLSSAAAPVK